MTFSIDTDLPAPLTPVAWLIGTWAGAGVVGYPSMEEDIRFGQEVTFRHDGRPFLHYSSQTWLLDEDGNQVRPLASEVGYWRVGPASESSQGGGQSAELEVLLAHPTGFVETYLGKVDGPRVQLQTDLVARLASAKEYTAATRMYGLVEGDLMWVMDMSAVGHELTSHLSARLKRM